uniref:Cytochrome b n=1 Tax=Monodontina vondembuschiana TaxID=2508272 RepID=A0A513X0G6_9BIVA|nr:cytochrome b [Monodontina vondembuschiana]
MKEPMRKSNQMLNIMNSSVYDLPTPLNLSTFWNSGSLLGLCLMIQIISGIFLAIHYMPNTEHAFQSVVHMVRDVNFGWMLRNAHATGASLFFLCVYAHIGRGIYFSSYLYSKMWLSGVILLFTLMATAFLGYVLPWGQMSYWGATVITNLLSVIPYLGNSVVNWVWGGFTVANATLNRFFVFHFLLPFILLALVCTHLMLLHETGSNNPLGLQSSTCLIPFHPFYTLKDLVGFLLFMLSFILISMFMPTVITDPENFVKANPMSTPTHIQPEWYFLFAYAILRAIPNKAGGVLALTLSILVLLLMPIMHLNKMQGMAHYPMSQPMFWTLVATFFLLTWLGQKPTEPPMVFLSQTMTITYFSLMLTMPIVGLPWDKLVFAHQGTNHKWDHVA